MSRLVVEKLRVRRAGKTVVNDLSFSLESGRITSLLGPNGAGKSSLVLALAGVLPIESGSIRLDDRELVGRSPEAVRGAGVAAVPEGHRVLSGLSVEDNLQAAGFQHSAAEMKRILADAFCVFPELQELRRQRAGSMSGGQQQMLALAQALIAKPKFILADEMSLGLAPLIVKRLMRVVSSLAEQGIGVLLIEQFTGVALKLAAEAHVMARGAFRYSGPPGPLVQSPEILHAAYLA
jgi:branched-chain amino acid transport system ATP-binding protein